MRVAPKKSLGQNFLVNQGILEKIVRAARITSNDTVLEIGPGTGALTRELAQRAGSVIAVEKDRRLIPELQEQFGIRANVRIVEGDVLFFKPSDHKLQASGYKIVGNIPYYITSRFLKTVLESWPAPELIVLTVQKEVAERICAKPPHMNLLALSVRFYAEPEIVGKVSRGSFRPVPNVDSAIIKLTIRNLQPTTQRAERFFKLLRAGFAHKRKKLISNLAGGLGIQKTGLEEIFKVLPLESTVRPEELSLDQWLRLLDHLMNRHFLRPR